MRRCEMEVENGWVGEDWWMGGRAEAEARQGVTECSRHLKLNTCSAAVIRIFEKDVWDC